MIYNDFSELPEAVKNFVYSSNLSQINGEIFDNYNLSRDQKDLILNLEEGIFLKKMPVLDLPFRLDEMEDAANYDMRALALDLATNVLWPLQDFLGNVDRLILRLGGKVPRIQHLTVEESTGMPNVMDMSINEAMNNYPGFKDFRLTLSKIINKEGIHVSGSLDNWIKDYVHFLGAGQHASIDRAKYLAKNQNALALTDIDRETLRFALISYDDNIKVHIEINNELLRISEFQTVTQKKEAAGFSREDFIKNIQQQIVSISSGLLSANMLMSEAQNDLYKLRDILWQAIGLADRVKAISCLKLLIEKKALEALIREDNRFKSILKRFVGVRYGYGAENSMEQLQDLAILRRLFLEMILAEKLALGNEAFAAALYLTNILDSDTQVVYLDEKEGKMKWRALQLIKDKLIWVESEDNK